MSRQRLVHGYLLAAVLLPLLVLGLEPLRETLNLASDVLVFLLAVVVIALVGGLGPAVVAAVASTMLLNFFFTEPRHTLAIDDANNALALVVFVAVALLVSWVVGTAVRRTQEARDAAAEARRLSGVAAEAARLEEGNKLRTALLAAVGHDLRTPLATAKAVVSALLSRDVDLAEGDRQELLSTSDEALDKLSGLVDNLLDMSRLQAGGMTAHLQPVRLEEVLASALEDDAVHSRDVVLEVPDELPELVADPVLLERVLVNLIANAQKYSPGAPTLSATVRDGLVEVSVIDHGPGIPERDRERVFLPFQRLGDTDNQAGVGLGLALSRGLAEVMGGGLAPRDTPGGGLTMLLSLPVAP